MTGIWKWYLNTLKNWVFKYWCIVFSICHFSNISSTDLKKTFSKKPLRDANTARWLIVRRSQKFCPATDSLPGRAGRPKFNQLEMVTTFTYKVQTQFGEDRCMQFRVIVATDPQTNSHTHTHTHTHKPTDRTDYNTLRRSYYLLVNPQILCMDKLTLIWVSTTIVSCQKILDVRRCSSDNSAKSCMPKYAQYDNAYFFTGWMYYVMVKYLNTLRMYLNTNISIWVFK